MNPYKLRYRVYSSFGGQETETFLDNYDDIFEFINTNIHLALRSREEKNR